MGAHSTDIFGPVEEGGNNGENVSRRKKNEKSRRERRIVAAPKRKEKWRTMNQTMTCGVRYVKQKAQRSLHERCQTASG